MFDKILIANRGEIACRIIKTARRLGIRTVAVYSDADAGARHVRLADEALPIGPAPARDSYLNAARLIETALAAGANAVHPGYGFLAENADFAEACERAGLVFIGPPASAIRAMGSKSAAKALLEHAGVPLVPGYHGASQDADYLEEQAARIGYPVLIKAAAGGGGKGMRIVATPAEFRAALASCRREAASSFGDDRVLVEKYITRPRHIEIQVFADRHGNCVHLYERDCSVQRRYQKVVEEAPAPGMTSGRRAAMGDAAIAAARAVGYVGAGTVEFIVAPDGAFYFMEMNTRLQVEHPVTEMITGLDLVEWQLRVAAGEALPLSQEEIGMRGHAIEARVYAENPERDFLPAPGRLLHLALPEESARVRVDSGVEEGDVITPHYDPMIAKLVVWGETRERARRNMLRALAACRIVGVASNVEFLARLMRSSAFAAADLDTGLIEREREFLLAPAEAPPGEVYFLAALAELLRDREAARARAAASGDPYSPWHAVDGWRLNAPGLRPLVYRSGDREVQLLASPAGDGYRLQLDGAAVTVSGRLERHGAVRMTVDGRTVEGAVVAIERTRHVFLDGRSFLLEYIDRLHHDAETELHEGGLRAPMPGKITALLVAPGTKVERGAPLLVLEAMKMEHTIIAPGPGTVRAVNVEVGDQVSEGAELVDIELEN
ncbi:MAG TPA: acetyl/propionyl/methylcrotonyl-CoA carboxylase subunit alpha [Burkholderiales bacterium]